MVFFCSLFWNFPCPITKDYIYIYAGDDLTKHELHKLTISGAATDRQILEVNIRARGLHTLVFRVSGQPNPNNLFLTIPFEVY